MHFSPPLPSTKSHSAALLPSALVLAAASAFGITTARAQAAAQLPGEVEACALLRVDGERLACYDRVMATRVRGAAAGPAAAASPNAAATVAVAPEAKALPAPDSFLDEYWELSAQNKRGAFNFNGYRPNYFLPIHATTSLNRSPTTPSPGHAGSLPAYRNVESKLQISVRTKLAQDVGLPGGDVWFGYTQQSLWQLYTGDVSRPFRSTDHEPEIVYIVPTPLDLPLGLKLKMAGIGLAHQSNGQTLPFSRSWNRTYALAGVEKGDFALTYRYNKRIHESDGNDDNPDLTSYRGRTELLGVWTPGVQTLTAQWRTNFNRRGSLQLDWTMPVNRKDPKGLRWYAQVFTGYGETLIDYNFRQSSLGLGVSLFGW